MAAKLNIPILQASTSEIYGDPSIHPQKEDYWGNVNPVGPRACYDEGKRVAEALCMAYKSHSGVQIRIARIFNTYGPYMSPDDGRVVSNFIVQALQGNNITIYGNGEQTRSFCFVDDLIDGLILLINSDYSKPVNLGNPEEFSILQLAEIIMSATGTNTELVYLDLPEDDPHRRKPDISLAKKVLGWYPSISIDQGLEATINWFKLQI